LYSTCEAELDLAETHPTQPDIIRLERILLGTIISSMADKFRIGEKLAKLRAEKNRTIDEVAEDLNLPRSTYYGYEQGSTVPKLEFIEKVAAYYNVDPSLFLSGNKLKADTEPGSELNHEKAAGPSPSESMWGAMMERTKSLEELLARAIAMLERMSKRGDKA
jgi:transcriptional regulator with XRE-family HTH domain